MKRLIISLLVAAFAVAMLSIAALSGVEKKNEGTAAAMKAEVPATMAVVDQAAPDFTLMDANGQKHSLSDYKGKYVVLEWVNFDCPFVKKHYGSGNMPKLQEELAKDGVVWLSICSSAPGKQGHFEGKDLFSRMVSEKIKSTAYLIDTDGKVGRLYNAKTTPNMFLVNPEGVLLYAGAIDDKPTPNPDDIATANNYIKAAFAAAKSGKPVETKLSQPYGCSVKY